VTKSQFQAEDQQILGATTQNIFLGDPLPKVHKFSKNVGSTSKF